MEVFRKVRLDSGRDAVYACTPGQVTATHIRQLGRQVPCATTGTVVPERQLGADRGCPAGAAAR